MQSVDATDQRAAGQIAVVFLLCGALGAFTRNLIAEIESHRAAAIDQAAEMATANELLVSLHTLAKTLPSSFDLREVVDSMRLTGCVPSCASARSSCSSATTPSRCGRVELAEGVRLPAHLNDYDLPQPLQRALTSQHPILIDDRLVHPDEGGFAALARSGLYTALRARGALVGPDRARRRRARRVRAASSATSSRACRACSRSRSTTPAGSPGSRTLGAEAERARIARELHDRVAQSLAYVAFELERMHDLPGEKDAEIADLRVVVRDIVRELRETIYQLRANVSEAEDIVMVAGGYLERFAERTGITTHWLPSASAPLPYRIEQELWRIGQEALVNVERHCRRHRGRGAVGGARRRRPARGGRQRDGIRARNGRRRALRPRGHAGTCRCNRCPTRDREPPRTRDEGGGRVGR